MMVSASPIGFKSMPEGHTTILHSAFCILHSAFPINQTAENGAEWPFLRSEGVHRYSERAKKGQNNAKSVRIRYADAFNIKII